MDFTKNKIILIHYHEFILEGYIVYNMFQKY